MSEKKEDFVPLNGKNVGIYACGMTVYDKPHIGHARKEVAIDLIVNYLKYSGFSVTYVRNFTDIDDKIIARANERGIDFRALTEENIEAFYKAMDALGLARPDIEPKATAHIGEIISMVQKLIDKGFAYSTPDGSVYFAVEKFKGYGKLSGRKLDEMISGTRFDVEETKVNPLDFALWKASKPGEPKWESPWGEGRPGWHIECSAMSTKYLGESFDIHAGGRDLIFPHHENEIAQSECANNKILARFWLHNGFININNKKMSKSLNNFFTVREIAEKYGYQPIRYLMISSHYKSPLNFSDEIIKQCQNSLERLSNFRKNLENLEKINNNNNINLNICDNIDEIRNNFIKYMDDDLNTSGALSVIFDMIKDINNKIAKQEKYSNNSIREIIKLFDDLTQVLGLKFESQNKNLTKEIEDLLAKREFYRKNKNWSEADKIRDLLKSKGYDIQDSKSSTSISIR